MGGCGQMLTIAYMVGGWVGWYGMVLRLSKESLKNKNEYNLVFFVLKMFSFFPTKREKGKTKKLY